MAKILITGGTGLIGSRLSKLLNDNNHDVSILTRNPKSKNEYLWNISDGVIDEKAFHKLDYIIHLAGAGIADKRWTQKRKQEIIDSRVKSTALLFEKITSLNVPLKGFISASGIGFYGAITSEKLCTETDPPASDFISKVCQLWETAAFKFASKEIPTTIFRTGIVLSKEGGALSKMKTPIISPIGSGKQYLPWIHIDDLCKMYLDTIENDNMSGVYNAVAPEHHTSKSFSKILALQLGRPFIGVGVPSILLKLIFGELSVILLKGSKISSKKIEQSGFRFKFPKLKEALQNLN